ncbi:MAG: hypothetical protein J0I25_06665 [Sphingomonadales bacterium]|nr:hypothetical protein [Sphingomonadales bacterium]
MERRITSSDLVPAQGQVVPSPRHTDAIGESLRRAFQPPPVPDSMRGLLDRLYRLE